MFSFLHFWCMGCQVSGAKPANKNTMVGNFTLFFCTPNDVRRPPFSHKKAVITLLDLGFSIYDFKLKN